MSSYDALKRYLSNPDNKAKHYERCKQWRESNPNEWAFMMLKAKAKRLGIPFDLEPSDLIIPAMCPVLGIPIERTRGQGPKENTVSVDRIDPSKGYTKGNIQVMSALANRMKNNATPEQLQRFAAWVLATYSPTV